MNANRRRFAIGALLSPLAAVLGFSTQRYAMNGEQAMEGFRIVQRWRAHLIHSGNGDVLWEVHFVDSPHGKDRGYVPKFPKIEGHPQMPKVWSDPLDALIEGERMMLADV